ncbi:FGGY-family carbohydrate kinase [Sedimentibacter sp. zth1]|uniref:FGGY-family carbohydrate kinase n=1 Tax=Sedimentibacter sp. zth1 TaxID=2816908 RepID=UPI001A90F6D7|nr:FGGY-family carbohydrate kinase [Sedimentibacter sp. zth1]QSX04854.1 FGGY-family carbohydrate kinase [Sedimentibacter sp. zth1]
MQLVLTFDIGTQSTRAMLINSKGDILCKAKKEHVKPYFSKNPGWAEQESDFYWKNLCEVSLKLKEKSAELWDDIVAVTCTCIRDTCVCVDKDGNALRDVILWLDKREAEGLKPLTAIEKLSFTAIGMLEAVKLQRKVSACNWIKVNEPEIWAKTYKFLFLSGFFMYHLSGKFIDSTASLIGHIPFDCKTKKWMKKKNIKRCIFDIDDSKLCDLVDPGDLVGLITEKASEQTGIKVGLPIIATGSDKGCGTLGLSCSKPEKAAISFGTTATIQLTTNYYMEPLPFIPAYPSVVKNSYNPEVQIYRGYWLISWFKREFAAKEAEEAMQRGIKAEKLLDKRLKEIKPGCNGLVFQPYFTPGVVMPKARGAIIGFSDEHTRQHIYRAIIEGINFALMDGLYTLQRRAKIKVKYLYVAGGGSQSDEICQITANMFGLPVRRIQTYEASGLGSSMVAFVSKGVFKDIDEAIKEMVHIKDEFIPDMDEHAIYKKLFSEIFDKIFNKLFPLYKKSYEIK